MIPDPIFALLLLYLLFLTTSILALDCFYCADPSQQIGAQIWMHKNNTCRKQRLVQCPSSSLGCVVVRVNHDYIDFTATGCSDDRFTGCDYNVVEKQSRMTTLRRCQCSKSLCNVNFELNFDQESLKKSTGPIFEPTTIAYIKNFMPDVTKRPPINGRSRDVSRKSKEKNRNLTSVSIEDSEEDLTFYQVEIPPEQESRSPKLGRSHMLFVGKIGDVLAKAGHEIVVFQPVLDDNITITGTKYGRVIERPRGFPLDFDFDAMQANVWDIQGFSWSKMQSQMGKLNDIRIEICKNQLLDTELMNKLIAEKFDLAIGEPFDMCYYGVVEKLGIKKYITAFAGAGAPAVAGGLFGIPTLLGPTSFVPGMFGKSAEMSYFQRAKNFAGALGMVYFLDKQFISPVTEALKPILGEHFDLYTKISESSINFVNADEHLDFPSPTSHKFINIGGIGQTQPKPLEAKYEQIFNSSKKGVVYMSFGSVAQSFKMPDVLKKKFLETFAQFPEITFLWKYEKDEHKIAEGYDNVITEKWLPQTDILAHPKLLAFITHGGANSVMEAAISGAPLICIPLMGDQPRNAQMAKYRGFAEVIEKHEILEGKLYDAIKTIINDDSYDKKAKKLSKMIKSKPMNSDERIIKYSEFVAEFGFDNNLDMQGRHLSFVQFYCLDIILPFLGLVLGILYVVYRLVRFILRKSFAILIVKKKVD